MGLDAVALPGAVERRQQELEDQPKGRRLAFVQRFVSQRRIEMSLVEEEIQAGEARRRLRRLRLPHRHLGHGGERLQMVLQQSRHGSDRPTRVCQRHAAVPSLSAT